MDDNNYSDIPPEITEFWLTKHVKYLRRCLDILPESLASMEVSRLTIAFFAISGLDLLNALDTIEPIKGRILEWIYSLQVVPDQENQKAKRCGFRGSTAHGFLTRYDSQPKSPMNKYDGAHIAMTYTGLSSLIILGDDLGKVNKKAILESLIELQHPNGSFQSLPDDSENDMRFVYCATHICYMLNDWSGMDVEKTVDYIKNSITYEGGISQGPGLEAHGGSTYCAIASLVLLDRLNSTFSPAQLDKLRRWCLFKQETGFQGRPNKPPDTCYSFWVGATLKLLDAYHMVDFNQNRNFLLSTQDPITGGLSKYSDTIPDLLHTYFGIAGLSLMVFPDIQTMNPALNMTTRAVKHLEYLHEKDIKN